MNCKKQFNREFLIDCCTSVFLTTTYKDCRQNILFDREKGLFIETQPYVVVEKEKLELREQIYEMRKDLDKIDAQRRRILREIDQVSARMINLNVNNSQNVEEARKFIRKCPMNECKGFLSSRWKCGTCDVYICNKCNELNDTDHICNPDNVASMELLNKDTKPCPECATMIFRIEGCPQMWCTNCNTPWDWNTGKKVNGTIHNPHYYQFIRNGGGVNRNHADIPCGGLPYLGDIRTMCDRLGIQSNIIYNIHNVITHIQNHEMREHPIPDIIVFNRNLRVSYILNRITEIEFKKTLQINEKSIEKHRNFNNIFQMFVNVSSDILRQMIEYFRSNNDFVKCNLFLDDQMIILNNLIEYFNENLKILGKRYKVVYGGIIIPGYSFQSNIETYKIRNKLI